MYIFAILFSMQDPSSAKCSPTRNGTSVPCSGRRVLTTGPSGSPLKVLTFFFFISLPHPQPHSPVLSWRETIQSYFLPIPIPLILWDSCAFLLSYPLLLLQLCDLTHSQIFNCDFYRNPLCNTDPLPNSS